MTPTIHVYISEQKVKEPVAIGTLTKEKFDAELQKGLDDMKAGRVSSLEAVEARIRRDYGI